MNFVPVACSVNAHHTAPFCSLLPLQKMLYGILHVTETVTVAVTVTVLLVYSWLSVTVTVLLVDSWFLLVPARDGTALEDATDGLLCSGVFFVCPVGQF